MGDGAGGETLDDGPGRRGVVDRSVHHPRRSKAHPERHRPEFIAKTIRRLADLTGVENLYVEPRAPWKNGYAESFHSRLRDELLNAEVFLDVRDAAELARRWREEYNERRPHSSLCYVPPAVFAAKTKAPSAGEALRCAAGIAQGEIVLSRAGTVTQLS